MKLLKNKTNLIISIIVLVVVIAAAIVFIAKLSYKPNASQEASAPMIQVSSTVPSISASDIGLSLAPGSDNHSVSLRISKTSDISSLDYQLSYYSTGHIQRGIIGHIDVKKKGQAINQNIVLGTCSDVCHYDQGVSSVSLILKVTKTNGKVYQATDSLKL